MVTLSVGEAWEDMPVDEAVIYSNKPTTSCGHGPLVRELSLVPTGGSHVLGDGLHQR